MATVKELQQMIREQTMDINRRLNTYYESKEQSKQIKREIEYLKEITGTSPRKDYLAMNTHSKSKADLELQLTELRHFAEWDIETPGGKYERSQKELAAWRAYKRNHASGLSFNSWRKSVAIMGSIDSSIIKWFGGDTNSAIEIVEDAVRKGRKTGDIMKAMQEVIEENSYAGKDPEDYADDLRSKLNLTV